MVNQSVLDQNWNDIKATLKSNESYDVAAQKLGEGYKQASRYAKENPGAAVAILFGSGLLAGLGVALLTRRR